MRFDQPVGTPSQRADDVVYSGGWVDATGFGTLYRDSGGNAAYHTGVDLNLNTPVFDSDAHSGVYASAGGLVVFAGIWNVWGTIIVVKHNNGVWTRYGHVENIIVKAGEEVKRGQQLASVGKPPGGPFHLHFDVSTKDLGVKPSDWPGLDLVRLKVDYLDPLIYLREHRKEDVVTTDLITADRLNLRAAPSTDGVRIVVMPVNTVVRQLALDATQQWAQVSVPATITGQAVELQGWASKQWLRPLVVQPPLEKPALSAAYLLGVHVLNFAEDAQAALELGCRTIHVMNSFVGDWNLHKAYPDAVVMRRCYVTPGSSPSPTQMVSMLGVDPSAGQACTGGGMYVFNLSNEGDVQGYGSAAKFEAQFHWEAECVRRIHAIAPYAKIAMLSAAHGNPDWTKADIREVFNRLYVPFLHANSKWAIVDTHAYTLGKRFPAHPPADAKIYAPVWLETRNQLMCEDTKVAYPELAVNCCNLNTAVKHVSGEAGVEAGHGGFNWAGYTPVQFREWCIEWLRLQRASVAPYSAAAVFQFSRRNDWAGYDIRGYKDVLHDLWTKDVATPTFKTLLATHGAIDDKPPEGYHPPRKEYSFDAPVN